LRPATFHRYEHRRFWAGKPFQAISNANSSEGPDTIQFNIPTSDANFLDGVFKIQAESTSALPAITEQVLIDGFSQTAFTGDTNRSDQRSCSTAAARPRFPANGLTVASGTGTVIQGLVIHSFRGDGISIGARATCDEDLRQLHRH
jgi:hypothetical protein